MPASAEYHLKTIAPPILEIHHLRREANGTVLVDDVSISVTKGEIIARQSPCVMVPVMFIMLGEFLISLM